MALVGEWYGTTSTVSGTDLTLGSAGSETGGVITGDGTGVAAYLSDNSVRNTGGSWSVEYDLRFDSTHSGSGTHFELRRAVIAYTGGTDFRWIAVDGGGNPSYDTSGTWTAETWYHIRITYDYPTGVWSYYVDGSYVDGHDDTNNADPYWAPSGNTLVVLGSDDGDGAVAGDVKNLRLYDTVQSTDDTSDVDNPSSSTALVVAALDLAVALDGVALTQAHTLVVAALDLAVALDGPLTITEHTADTLAVQPLDLVVTLEGVAVGYGRWPTSVSGRLVLDQNGDPWIATGDSAWSIFAQLSLAEAQTYIDSIAGYGYNAMLTMLVVKAALQDGSDGTDYLGRSAWTGTAFQSTLNTAYWDHVDDIIEYAASKNVTVIACPAYIGFERGSQGWTTETTAASDAQMDTYGGYIGGRLKDHPNLMWLIGHDATPNATDLSRQGAIVDGIKGAGDTHLMMCDGARSSVGTTVWAGWSNLSDMDVETAYVDYDDVKTITTAAWNAGTRPVLVPEGQYQDHPTGYPDDVVGRNQFWASFLAGAKAGYVAGHYYVHTFQATSPDWDTYLDDEIYDDTSRAGTLLRTLAWDTLTPDTADTFLTGGEGSGSTAAAAAFATTAAVVYMPTSREVTLDLTELTATTCTITRVDPTSGAESVLTTSGTGSYVVSSQGTNAGLDSDWLLLVEPSPALTVAALDLAVALEGPLTLTQHAAGSLVVQPLDLAVALDGVALTQAHTLVVAALDLAVALDGVAITVQAVQLTVAGLDHTVTLDGVALSVTHVLVVQSLLLAVLLGSAESVSWSLWVGGVEVSCTLQGVYDGSVVRPVTTVEVVS